MLFWIAYIVVKDSIYITHEKRYDLMSNLFFKILTEGQYENHDNDRFVAPGLDVNSIIQPMYVYFSILKMYIRTFTSVAARLQNQVLFSD